jgi:hypothetical protein
MGGCRSGVCEGDMVRISQAGPDARSRLVRRGPGAKGYELRAPIREAIAALRDQETIELAPDPGESMRRVKLVAGRAGKEAGRDIQYGETREDTLLVWLAEPTRRRRRRTGATQDQAPLARYANGTPVGEEGGV